MCYSGREPFNRMHDLIVWRRSHLCKLAGNIDHKQVNINKYSLLLLMTRIYLKLALDLIPLEKRKSRRKCLLDIVSLDNRHFMN